MSGKIVGAVWDTVDIAVDRAVLDAIDRAVWVAVDIAIDGVVWDAVGDED